MTTATAPDYALAPTSGRNYFLLRRLHSLTGLIFGGYLIVHLLVNATLAQMGDVYQTQVNKIHELPMLWAIEFLLIYVPILFHTFYGIYIVATGQPNTSSYPYTKNWFYVFQRVSAIVLVFFMFFHVFALKFGWFGASLTFDPHFATVTIHRHMKANMLVPWIVYPIGIMASCYHLANGFWTAAITWGLTISAASQRRFGFVCTGLFAITMIFGFVALVAATTYSPSKSPLIPTTAMERSR